MDGLYVSTALSSTSPFSFGLRATSLPDATGSYGLSIQTGPISEDAAASLRCSKVTPAVLQAGAWAGPTSATTSITSLRMPPQQQAACDVIGPLLQPSTALSSFFVSPFLSSTGSHGVWGFVSDSAASRRAHGAADSASASLPRLYPMCQKGTLLYDILRALDACASKVQSGANLNAFALLLLCLLECRLPPQPLRPIVARAFSVRGISSLLLAPLCLCLCVPSLSRMLFSWCSIFSCAAVLSARVCFLHMLACECLRSKAWLAARVSLSLACMSCSARARCLWHCQYLSSTRLFNATSRKAL